MSSARICPYCRWKFPSTYTLTACKFCKTRFNEQICFSCKQLYPTSEFGLRKNGYLQRECKICASKRISKFWVDNPEKRRALFRRYIEKHRLEADESLYKWMASTEIKFKPLSEEEWLRACSYFGGCALCGNSHIETRQYFIPHELGGKYAAWNIFPMCGRCSKYHRRIQNPFRWLNKDLYRSNLDKYYTTEERVSRLVDYLILQIEKAGGKFEKR